MTAYLLLNCVITKRVCVPPPPPSLRPRLENKTLRERVIRSFQRCRIRVLGYENGTGDTHARSRAFPPGGCGDGLVTPHAAAADGPTTEEESEWHCCYSTGGGVGPGIGHPAVLETAHYSRRKRAPLFVRRTRRSRRARTEDKPLRAFLHYNH